MQQLLQQLENLWDQNSNYFTPTTTASPGVKETLALMPFSALSPDAGHIGRETWLLILFLLELGCCWGGRTRNSSKLIWPNLLAFCIGVQKCIFPTNPLIQICPVNKKTWSEVSFRYFRFWYLQDVCSNRMVVVWRWSYMCSKTHLSRTTFIITPLKINNIIKSTQAHLLYKPLSYIMHLYNL